MDSITPLYTKAVKRLRVFAGPNGAGKSSTRGGISELGIRLGKWINADDLLGLFTSGNGTMSLSRYLVSPDVEHFRSFYMKHSLVAARNLPWCFTTGGCAGEIGIDKKILADTNISAYVMSIMADYLRTSLVKAGESFAFETVFSHPSKLDFMRSAKAAGYRIYLYFVCVEPPELCVSRVAIRVAQSGHNVPKEKILGRYKRCLSLLAEAIEISDRVYLFDNSETAETVAVDSSLCLEVENRNGVFSVIPHRDVLPHWITDNVPISGVLV